MESEIKAGFVQKEELQSLSLFYETEHSPK